MHKVTICPCCGFRFEGDLREGCTKCHARSVGEPLPKPEFELPAYGRALLLTIMGSLMILGFAIETVIALAQNVPLKFGFWDFMAAGETAAWRLKWIAIPITFIVLGSGWRIYRSMRRNPTRFVGMSMARRGLFASAMVSGLVLMLIGVTIPERLRQRQWGIEAGINARAYTIVRAQSEYQALHGTVPVDIRDLYELPDQDGSIAAALRDIDPAAYLPRSADIAVIPAGKSRRIGGVSIRNASVSTSEEQPPAVSFTNYDLRLPGPDKILRTDDDLLIRDGVIYQASEKKDAPLPVRPAIRAGRR